MTKQTGVTTNTSKRLLIDAGAIFIDYGELSERKIGATRDGASFVIEQEFREVPLDGAVGAVKGTRRLTKEKAMIKANFLEISEDNLLAALTGATSSTTLDVITITRANFLPAATAYFTNVALVGTIQGAATPAIFIIKNALADGNFEVATSDADEANPEVQFTAHFDPAALETSPWEIRLPVEV